jgi:23S rRNA pseudouridine2605 synthase
VNGHVVTELGTRVDPRRDRIEVDNKRVVAERHVYLIMHKPRGVVSTMSDPEGRPTVKELLGHVEARVYPVGRLDFATSGVLLATNDGAFADGLLHPKKAVPKTYVVKVAGTMNDDDLDRWRNGVELDDGKTLPAEVSLIRHEAGEGGRGKTWFEVTIREGRNQQIRRMGVATGFEVMRLSRTAFAGVTSEDMRPGAVRSLTHQELTELKKAYGVPRSIPSDIEPNMSKPQLRAPWRIPRDNGPPHKDASTEHAPPNPRYGMGAPGRRSPDVTEDYGGRSGRGSSGTRDNERTERGPAPRGGLGGGRFAPTRTTGTGGGINAPDAPYRLKTSNRPRRSR